MLAYKRKEEGECRIDWEVMKGRGKSLLSPVQQKVKRKKKRKGGRESLFSIGVEGGGEKHNNNLLFLK